MRKYNNKISEKANESLSKREAIVKKQRTFLAILVTVLISSGILLGSSINALASSKADVSSYYKYYTSVKIEEGDTLWSMADEYIGNFNLSKAEYIKEICQINDISKNEIYAGDYIVIPYYSNEIK